MCIITVIFCLINSDAKISEYQMPNDQKSSNYQKMYAKQLGQLFL